MVNGVDATLSITSAISPSLPTSERGRNTFARWPPCWVPSFPSLGPPVALVVMLAASQTRLAVARAPGVSRVASFYNIETRPGCQTRIVLQRN